MTQHRDKCNAFEDEIRASWLALGEDPDAPSDDPDCATLRQCISIALQYERDAREQIADDRDKLRGRIALLEDLCRKAVDPCVSYWMVVEPGIRTALACKETHND